MRKVSKHRLVLVRLFRVAAISILVSTGLVSIPTVVHAATSAGLGGTINVGPSSSLVVNNLLPGSAGDIQALNYGSETITAIVTASSGTVAVTYSTGLTVPTGYQTSVTTPAAVIGLYGAVSDVNAALNTLTYAASSTSGPATITTTITDRGSGAIAYDTTTGNYFQAVTTADTWDQAYNAITGDTLTDHTSLASVAKRQAQSATGTGATLCAYVFNGMCGYFATIYNSAQDTLVTSKVGTDQAWLGGSDRYHEGQWVWADPKAPAYNKQFSDQSSGITGQTDETGQNDKGTGSNPTGQPISYTVNGNTYSFVQWNNNEPNNSGGNENALQIVAGGNGNWNDLSETASTLNIFIVEYGGLGEVQTYAPSTSTINVNVGYTPNIYVGTTNGSGTVTYRATTSLTATINPAGKVTFYANGKAIPGCKNLNASPYTVVCSTWKPSQQNLINLTARIVPTNGSYSTATSPTVVLRAVMRSTTR